MRPQLLISVAISHIGHLHKPLVFCLDSTTTVRGKSQVGLARYKRGCLPSAPSLSLTLLLLPLSLALLLPLSPHSLPPTLRVAIAGLYFSTLSLCLPSCAYIPPLSFPSQTLLPATINTLKPWTASSYQDPQCWNNGAGLPLKSHAPNPLQKASLCSQAWPIRRAASHPPRELRTL